MDCVRVFGLVVVLMLTSACGGGDDDDNSGGSGDNSGGSDPGPITASNNLRAIELQVVTPEPKISFPLKASVSLSADAAVSDVTVSLFAVEKVDDSATETRQFPLGTQTIDLLSAGAGVYEVDVNLPSTISQPGSYYLSAVVDPVNLITETDETDNLVTVEAVLAPEGPPNIILEALNLDRQALEISTSSYEEQLAEAVNNVHNADAGATIIVGSDGLSENESINLEAFALLRLNRSDVGTSHDVPLYLWNSNEGRYMNAYGGTSLSGSSEPEWLPVGNFTPQRATRVSNEVSLDAIDRHSVFMNFYFPGKLGQEIELAMRYPNANVTFGGPATPPPDLSFESVNALRSFLNNLPSNGIDGDESAAMAAMDFEICVEVRSPSLSTDSIADDNQKCSPLQISLPPIPPPPLPDNTPDGFLPEFLFSGFPLLDGDGYKTKGGNSNFGFELDFSATATADNRGYIEEVRGSVPVTVFGTSVDFFSFSGKIQLVPDYAGKPADESSGYSVSLRHLGQVLHAQDFPATSPPAVSISFSKEAPDPEKSFNAFVGPIPVTGGASAAANIGVEYEFTFDTNTDVCTTDPTFTFLSSADNCLKLGNSLSPFVNLEGTLFAGVGNSLFSAGVEGVLTMLDSRLTLFSGAQIDVKDYGFASGISEFIITQGTRLDFIFTGPRGAINLFAKYTVPAFEQCNWGPIPAFCPVLRTLKATKNLIRTPALFKFTDNLFRVDNQQLDVVVVPGEEPGYYSR